MAGQIVTLAMTSESFDTRLFVVALTDHRIDWAEENDDYDNSTTDSMLEVTLPRTDDYYVVATSWDDGLGQYNLFVIESTIEELAEVATSGAGNRWVYLGESSDGGVLRADSQSLEQHGARSTMWLRKDFDDVQAEDWGFDKQLSFYEFDCQRKRARLLSYAYYRDGEVVGGSDEANGSWFAVVPESASEAALGLACAKQST